MGGRSKKDLSSSEKNGESGNPAFFVNGEPFEDEPAVEDLIAVLTVRAD